MPVATMHTESDLFDDPRKRFSDFALKDYELKVAYLTNHFQRMWTRFNYFVIIEAALLGGRTIFGEQSLTVPGIVFGVGLSAVWYVMGAEDRYLVQVYRKHVDDAAKLLGDATAKVSAARSPAVGQLSDARMHFRNSLSGWRVERISTTRLAALIPLAVTLAWSGMLLWKLIA
jgi:hypothetical protein